MRPGRGSGTRSTVLCAPSGSLRVSPVFPFQPSRQNAARSWNESPGRLRWSGTPLPAGWSAGTATAGAGLCVSGGGRGTQVAACLWPAVFSLTVLRAFSFLMGELCSGESLCGSVVPVDVVAAARGLLSELPDVRWEGNAWSLTCMVWGWAGWRARMIPEEPGQCALVHVCTRSVLWEGLADMLAGWL